jgi:hypothetical protein
MNTKLRIFAATTSLAMSAAILPAPAYAGGFIGDVIDQVAPGVGTALNQLNRDLGHPTEAAGAAVIDAYIPGGGRVAQQVWNRNANGGRFTQPNGPQQSFPQQQFGNFCYTQMGRFGPGPVNPMGSQCWINDAYGNVVYGQVGQ